MRKLLSLIAMVLAATAPLPMEAQARPSDSLFSNGAPALTATDLAAYLDGVVPLALKAYDVAGVGFSGGFFERREANMMRVADHHSEQQLQQLADQEPRADLAKRLRTIALAKQGFTAPEIATCTGFSRRAAQKWVERYNREGLAGLKTKPGRGRKPPLSPEEADQLKQRLDAGPLPDDGVCTLRGKDVQRILQHEFGQLRSLNAVYGLLHRLGYSSLVPRPQHPQADPAAQEECKKNSPTGSARSKRNIPAVD
jgi:transposase